MSELVERILAALREKEDWLVVLEQELNGLDSTSSLHLLEQVFITIAKEGFPLPAIKDLILFNEKYANLSNFHTCYLQAISMHGKEEVFGFVMEKLNGELAPVTVYESAAQKGKERLLQVLVWLEDLTDNYEMLESYIRQVEWYYRELIDIQKLVIVEGSKSLHIDPFTHGWGKEGGIVRNWLASVANDV